MISLHHCDNLTLLELGMRGVACEVDAEYFQIGNRRLQEVIQQNKLILKKGQKLK